MVPRDQKDTNVGHQLYSLERDSEPKLNMKPDKQADHHWYVQHFVLTWNLHWVPRVQVTKLKCQTISYCAPQDDSDVEIVLKQE